MHAAVKGFIFLVGVIALALVQCSDDVRSTSGVSDVSLLLDHISSRGIPAVRPVTNHSAPVIVHLKVTVEEVTDLDELHGQLHSHIKYDMVWRDEFIVWNPSRFGDVQSIQVPVHLIWKPDVSIFNSVSTVKVGSSSMATVTSDGIVTWSPDAEVVTSCAAKLLNFPFDSQSCELNFVSWMYSNSEVDLRITEEQAAVESQHSQKENHLWDVTVGEPEINTRRFPGGEYTHIIYKIDLSRHLTYYREMLVAPSVVFGLMMPLMFLLPHIMTDRILLCSTLCLAANMYAGALMKASPHAFQSPPTLAIYLLYNIAITTTALVFSTFIVHQKTKGQRKKRLPAAARKIFLDCVGCMLLTSTENYLPTSSADDKSQISHLTRLDGVKDEEVAFTNGNHAPAERQNIRDTIAAEWSHLASVLDRLCFIVFMTCVIVPLFFLF